MTQLPSATVRAPRRSFATRLRRRAYRAMPFLIWLAVLALVLAYSQRGRTLGETRGIAQAERHRIIAPIDGTLRLLSVSDHDPVTPGQIVAALADEDLRLRVARARIELEALRAELTREAGLVAREVVIDASDRGVDQATDLRRFHRDIESAVLDVLETRAEIEETTVRQRGVGIELQRTHALVARGAEAPSRETDLAIDHAALGVRIDQLRGILEQRETRVPAARERLAAAQLAVADLPVDSETLIEPFRWRIRAQEVELETLALLREQITLRTPIGGKVEQVLFRAGERVAAGDVLAVVVGDRARAVVAYVPEALRAMLEGTPVASIVDPRSPGRLVPSTIESVAPAVALTPRRLWRDPQIEEWAIPVRLSAFDGVLPGESVLVRWRR